MTFSEMMETVEENLGLIVGEHRLIISDVILMICDYCNLNQNCIPDILEPFVRKKSKVSWIMKRPMEPAIIRKLQASKKETVRLPGLRQMGTPSQVSMGCLRVIRQPCAGTGG